MNGFTLAPALGWIAGGLLATAMVALGVMCVLRYRKQRGRSDETVWSCARRTLLCLVIAAMALTPSMVTSTTSLAVNATDVVVAVDVTGSMGVNDAHYGSPQTISRLAAAKAAVTDITASYANASFAAVRFGVSGTLDVPLTPDRLAIDNWASTLAVEPTAVSAGSSLDAPLDQLLLTLKSIRTDHPNDAIVLYVITDGEQTSNTTRRTYSSLRQYLDDAFSVGVGSTQGGKIPVTASNGGNAGGSPTAAGGFVIDPTTGKPGISKMDETTLKAIADEMSGSCIILGQKRTLANDVSQKISTQWRTQQGVKQRRRITPVIWPLAIAAALLLAWELGAWIAASRRLL